MFLGSWHANEEEDHKSPFNGWLKAYQVAIDLREQISSAQGVKSWNRDQKLSGDKKDYARLEVSRAWPLQGRVPRFRGRTAAVRAAFRAWGCPLAPLFPGAYKNPLGFQSWTYTEFRVVFIPC